MRFMSNNLATLALLASLAMPWPAGVVACRSAEIRVDGTSGGLLSPRRAKVGETFTVSQAFDPRTGADWKLGAYDRALVEPITRNPYETRADGSMRRVYEFKARSPGLLELQFLHRNREPVTPGVAPPEPKKQIVKIKIVA